MTTNTHRFAIEGSMPTSGDIPTQSAGWEKIKAAFEALAKLVTDNGGTLSCVAVRIGKSKVAPAAPASQSSDGATASGILNPGTTQAAPEALGEAMQNAPIAGEPTPFPASRRGHGGEPKTAA